MEKNTSKRTTIKDLAKHTGYSIATISRVLNKKGVFYSEKTYKEIIKVAKQMNYHPDLIARGLKTNKTCNIAFLEPWRSEFFSEIAKGIQYSANGYGYTLAIYSSNYNPEQEKRNINAILSNRFDGVIIACSYLKRENIETILKMDIPLVVIEKIIGQSSIPSVSIKNRKIAKEAVNYLIGIGHKKIGFVSEPLDVGTINNRFKGYKDALQENNIDFNQEFVFVDDAFQKEIFEDSYNFIRKNIEKIKKLTALFMNSDLCAIAAIKALEDSGIKVPRDISVIGFDGLEFTKYFNPSITTIDQPKFDMGSKAMDLLYNLIKKQPVNDIERNAELVVRQSTKGL